MPRQKNGAETEKCEIGITQPDRFVQESWSSVRAQADRCLTDVTGYARQSPEKALLAAVAGGYVLRMLPLTLMVGALVRLILLLLKPAAFLYGGAKLWQKMQGLSLR